MPADHYRRRAVQARRLAGDATTSAIKQHLRELAAHLERLAEGVNEVTSG
jgi:recombinational DNA repair protein RecR